jgi:hypothetical protein
METSKADRLLRTIRIWLIVFVIGLVISGLTAFPIESEVRLATGFLARAGVSDSSALMVWLERVREALIQTNRRFPFLAYGTDWLAFAHLVVAIAFIGPIRDPVRNVWVVDFGLIACAAVIPLALIAGYVRGIPWWWRLIDCSFGVFGAIPLLAARRLIQRLQTATGPMASSRRR